ncbi:AAA family ATPase [Alkalihalobacillus pseudalcaliphilus]|uniref:AAA family ATPase n=1 Tax=Alkalihalobacillus pseudalcaliphilus TaxID=79884 RepID=UPI00064D8CF8|nr:AAA family ATPase [Alkalihalobacillus pseudalcaliphilus]KMK77287.1 hypothetical protein AB990_06995 [Alkalihalobacillus pseudalcaliphilus]
MNNLVSIRLENFQSHLDTWVDFDVGLNVIVGQSDSGKTAIIRAIQWALYNLPRGTDFIRVGANFVRVTLQFEGGITIIRERTSSKNRYMIQKPNEEELILEGFGTQVPKEVLEAHGMYPLRVDRDNELYLHVAKQLDGPFLLEQAGSVRAKTIGRISGAHYLDMAIRDTSKDVASLQQRKKQGQETVDQLVTQLKPYEELEKSKRQLEKSELLLEQIEQKRKKLDKWKELIVLYQRQQAEKLVMQRTLQTVEDVHLWEVNNQKLAQMLVKLKELQRKRSYVEETRKNRLICEQWIHKTKDIDQIQTLYDRVFDSNHKRLNLFKLGRQYQLFINQSKESKEQLRLSDFIKEEPIEQIDRIARLVDKSKKLKQLQVIVARHSAEKKKAKREHENYRDLTDVQQRIEQISQLTQRFIVLNGFVTRHKELDERLHNGKQFIESKLNELQTLELEYEQELLQRGTCPVCGQEVKELIEK